MALYTSSRYTLSSDVNGTVIALKKPLSKSLTAYSSYVTRDGDSFTALALRLFNDPTQYWVIADLNPKFAYADAIPVGSLIRLPS
jgi:hypothetical protein